MVKWTKVGGEVGGEAIFTNELSWSLVTEWILHTLVVEGKIASLDVVWANGLEVAPDTWENEAVVFVAFFDAGLCLLCVELVSGVLQLYGMELAPSMPNSIVNLGVFEWTMWSAFA